MAGKLSLKHHRLCSILQVSSPYLLGSLLLGSLIAMTAPPGQSQTSDPSSDGERRFICELDNDAYTVFYRPSSRPGESYPWATPTELGGGWTAERRCKTISDRLEQYRPLGLSELRTDIENGYNTVCATTEQSPDICSIVFTVPPGQDPIATRDSVFENLTLADGGIGTTSVNTYVGGNNSGLLGQISQVISGQQPTDPLNDITRQDAINLKPFLDPSDGGNGTGLNRTTSGRTLNPENFR